MARQKLTEKGLAAMKPPAKGQRDVFDLGGPPGFHVRVSQGGVKTFALLYSRGGKRRKWTIGRFPALSLAEARDKAKRADANKEDPQKAKVELRRATTFLRLMALYFQKNRRKLKPKTLKEWLRIAKVELRPELESMAPHEITRGDLRAFLERKAQKAPYMANRILEVVRRVYSWGVETDRVNASPCIGLKKPGVEKQRERVLSSTEIKTVLLALEAKPKPQSQIKEGETAKPDLRPYAPFFRLALLTAARKGELLTARWTDIDLEAALWTIPETKMGRSHVLPLARDAVSLLEALPRTGELVFGDKFGRIAAHPKRGIARLRESTGLEFRVHDLRRTAATGLAQLGVRTEVISAVLNHVTGGPEATRVYQRHHWIPEMREALERWSQELERIKTGKAAKVAAIR
jgi:integrase